MTLWSEVSPPGRITVALAVVAPTTIARPATQDLIDFKVWLPIPLAVASYHVKKGARAVPMFEIN
jgi:hypothetical protein